MLQVICFTTSIKIKVLVELTAKRVSLWNKFFCETSFPTNATAFSPLGGDKCPHKKKKAFLRTSCPAKPNLSSCQSPLDWKFPTCFSQEGWLSRRKFPWSKSPWITKKKSHPKKYTPKNYYSKEKSIIIDLPSNKSDFRLDTLIWEPVCKW